jgi:hypothetical protein
MKRQLKGAEIRLLEILPKSQGISDDEGGVDLNVQCAFIYANLDDAPTFEALSYVWGSETKEENIVLDGQNFLITASLHQALCHLRLAQARRVFWVDAVCIDQTNLVEKSNQVALMQRIYRSATSVTVFLGAAWEGCNLALDFFQAAADQPDHHYEPSLEPHLSVAGHDANSSLLRQNLVRLLGLPWWRRSWTVQEYALARTVGFQCGDRVLEGTVVQRAYANLRRHEYTCCWDSPVVSQDATFGTCLLHAFLRMDATELARELAGGHNELPAPELLSPIKFSQTTQSPEQRENHVISLPMTFLEALDTFREREYTDPRDKIYGITGLYFRDNVASFFKRADYSIPVEQLYTTLVHTVISESGKLDVLNRARGYLEPSLDLPSYVPDWSIAHPVEVGRNTRLVEYNASGGRPAQWTPVDSRAARTKAVFLDTISRYAEPYEHGVDLVKAFRDWAALAGLGFAADGFSRREGVFDRTAAFWRTLCGNTVRFHLDSKVVVQVLDLAEPRDQAEDVVYAGFLGWYAWATKSSDVLHTTEIADYMFLFERMNTGRKFVSTEGRRYGMAPAQAREGDIVAVIPGGHTPFVMRRVSGAGYKLIGETFFHGLMMGEGLQGMKDSDMEDVTLV